MARRRIALLASATLVLALASVAVAADPNGAKGHGADVSAVARAVHDVQGNAHGKAVSAIAKAHGKAVSAAAHARNAERQAAGKGNNGNASGKATGPANTKGKANERGQAEDLSSLEIGRVKVERDGEG